MHRARGVMTLVGVAVAGLACSGAEGDGAGALSDADLGIDVADVGFATPESVLHDPSADVYLVSNINGSPVDEDGNGFISRLTPDGEVVEIRWIDGAADGVTLNAPKGMAIQGSSLFVADIDCVRMFDLATGAPTGEVCVEGATFLNDVAPDDQGTLWVTDSGLQAGPGGLVPSGTDALYRLSPDGRMAPIGAGEWLGRPNGVAVGPRGVFVATFGTGEVFQVAVDGAHTRVLPASDRQLDGIEFLDDGGFMFSSWGDSCVYRVSADGSVERIVTGLNAPADIGYDRARSRVLIPLFNENRLLIRSLD